MSNKNKILLSHYMWEHRLTQAEFAELVGLSRTTIWKYLKGSNIDPTNRKKIEIATKKEILAKDLA